MRILVNGLPFFSERLVNDLSDYDAKNTYVFLNTYESFWVKLKFFLYLPFFDKVLSMNGVSDKSGSLSWVVKWKKPLLMLWQGTDVMIAVERHNKGLIYSEYINHASHFAVAPWLADELQAIGISANVLSFIWFQVDDKKLSRADEFSVLAYLAKGKEAFYGWPIIRDAFKELKAVKLYVVGSDGAELEQLDNVTFCGWLGKSEMQKLQQKCSVLVRMADHDGNSHLVSEALSAGLEVVWNYPHPQTHFANDSQTLKEKLVDLNKKFLENYGKKNQENIDWVKSNLSKHAVLENFIEKLEKL